MKYLHQQANWLHGFFSSVFLELAKQEEVELT